VLLEVLGHRQEYAAAHDIPGILGRCAGAQSVEFPIDRDDRRLLVQDVPDAETGRQAVAESLRN
jgi:hypothetical protein